MTNEADVQNLVRLAASKLGVRLFRNNVGASLLANGSFVRWGLANDSAEMNRVIKSADLIGIRPVVITPEHVGTTLGQFVSREIKAPNWIARDTDRERAQRAWATLVNSLGGDAAFTSGEFK